MIWMQTKITSMFIYGCVIMFSSSGACGAGGGSSRHSCWATGPDQPWCVADWWCMQAANQSTRTIVHVPVEQMKLSCAL